MQVDYSLYLVTDRGIVKGQDFFAAIEAAIQGGVTLLQLREKELCSMDFYHLAMKLKALTRAYGIPLIINDRLDIALAVDADGLHVGQEDLPVAVARNLLGPNKLLGYSVLAYEHALVGEKASVDYLGVGPIFPTGSKVDAAPAMGTEALRRIKASVQIPVVAIGGIGTDNIADVAATGADGISVISAILGQVDILGATKHLRALWQK